MLDFHANCQSHFYANFRTNFVGSTDFSENLGHLLNSKDPTTKILPTLQAKILV